MLKIFKFKHNIRTEIYILNTICPLHFPDKTKINKDIEEYKF